MTASGLPASAKAAEGTPTSRVVPRPRRCRRDAPRAGVTNPATRHSSLATRHLSSSHGPLHNLALRKGIPAGQGAGRESGARGRCDSTARGSSLALTARPTTCDSQLKTHDSTLATRHASSRGGRPNIGRTPHRVYSVRRRIGIMTPGVPLSPCSRQCRSPFDPGVSDSP